MTIISTDGKGEQFEDGSHQKSEATKKANGCQVKNKGRCFLCCVVKEYCMLQTFT